MALTSTVKKELYQFFAIAFDAAPGVTYMGQMADAIGAGMTVKQVVNVFTTKPEFTSVYPNFFTNEQFATKLVNNVVGSSADAAAKASAVADIAAALNAGWTRGDVIYQVFTNLANKPETDATWGNTAKQMANQVAYAEYYTEELLTDTTNLTSLRAVIANVTQDTDVSSAAIARALAPADTYATSTLGAGIDTVITPSASVNTIDGSTTANSLSSSDSITDASGSDSDKLVARFTADQTSVRPSITDIEKIEVQADAATVTMDLTRATGYDSLQVNGQNMLGGNGVFFTNVSNGDVALTVSALNAVNETVSVQYTNAALAGTNSMALTLDTVSNGNISLTDAGGTTNTLETVAITTTSGASTATLIDAGVNLTAITLAGDQNLTLALSGAGNLASISGSGFTGAFKSDLSGYGSTSPLTIVTGSGADSITGGSGNDVIISGEGADVITVGLGRDTVSAGGGADSIQVSNTGNMTIYGEAGNDTINMSNHLSAGDLVDGGVGNDILVLDGSTNASIIGASVSNVETILLGNDGATLSINSADVAAANGMTIDLTNAGNQTLNLLSGAGGFTGSVTAKLTSSATGMDTVNAAGSLGTINVVGRMADIASNDTIIGGNGADTLTLTADSNSTGADLTAVSKVERITIVANGACDAKITLGADTTNLTIDASALTNSSADLTLVANGYTANISVTGGAGADVITAGYGYDDISTGAGNDTVYFEAGKFTANDVVSGGAGVDTLALGDTSAIAAGSTANINSDIEIVKLTGAGASMSFNNADVSGLTVDLTSTGNQTLNLVAGANGFTGAVTVNLTASAAGTDYVNAAGSTGTVTVVGRMADIASDDSIIGGNGADALTLTADNNSTGADFTAVSKVETVTILGAIDNDAKLTLGYDSTNMTIDASGMSNVGADLTLVGTGYVGKLTVTSGAGNDTITGGNGADLISTGTGNDTINVGCGADTVSAGAGGDTIVVGGTGNMTIYGEAGNDTINMASYLTSGDVVSGGDGVDTLITTGNTSSASFTGVTGVETVKMYGAGMSLSLNNSDVTAFASGVTVDLTATDNQTLNLVAGANGFTGAVTVNLTASAAGTDYVNAAGSTGTVTVVGRMADIASDDSIIGGNGADALTLTADNNSTGADFTAVSKVETVTILGAIDNDAKLTLGGDSTNMTIDASGMTNVGAELTLVGTAYAGKLTVTSGAGNDTITGGNGADLISTGTGNDTINVGCGADTVSAGAGGDTIVVGGTGNMTIYGEAGNDTINMASYLTSSDVVSGGDGVDTLILSGNVDAGSFVGVSGIETVKLYGDGNTLSLNNADVAAFASTVTIDLTQAGNQTVNFGGGARAFNGDAVIKMTAGDATMNEAILASNSTGTVTIVGNVADIAAGDTIQAGGSASDKMLLTADNSTTGANFSNVTGITQVTITGAIDNDALITLGSDTVAMSINATSMTNTGADLNVVGGSYGGALAIYTGAGADSVNGGSGSDYISTGNGADVVTIGVGSDTVVSGSGNDRITVSNTGNVNIDAGTGNDTITVGSYLSSSDVISGGDGTDTLVIGGNTAAGGFTGVTLIEAVQITGTATYVNLGADDITAFASGVTVDLTASDNQTLNVSTAFTGSLTVKMTGTATGLDRVNAAGSAATFNVVGNMADIASNDTFIGGNGTDTFTLTADNNSTGANFTGVSKVETVTVIGAIDNDAKLTLGGDSTSLTIDATNMTNVGADFSLLGANYNGALTVTTGFGSDTVTGGSGTDYISTGNGADSIVGGAGADTIYGGAGNDTITGGTGADFMNGGAGSDTFIVTGNGVVSLDQIEGFVFGTDNDVIQISAAAGVSWGNEAIHYSSDGLVSNCSIIVLNDADSFASLAEATAYADQLFNMDTGDDADGGAYVFLWQDTNSVVHVSYGTATAGTDSSKDLVKLVGVSMSAVLGKIVGPNIDLLP